MVCICTFFNRFFFRKNFDGVQIYAFSVKSKNSLLTLESEVSFLCFKCLLHFELLFIYLLLFERFIISPQLYLWEDS